MKSLISIAKVSYDPGVDAATVYFVHPAKSHRTVVVDETRNFDYDEEGRILYVELLDVSRGVKLDGLPEPDLVRQALERIAREQGWETALSDRNRAAQLRVRGRGDPPPGRPPATRADPSRQVILRLSRRQARIGGHARTRRSKTSLVGRSWRAGPPRPSRPRIAARECAVPGRRTMTPALSAGSKRSGLAKSRSKLTSARPSAAHARNRSSSVQPSILCSTAVETSKPALAKSAAARSRDSRRARASSRRGQLDEATDRDLGRVGERRAHVRLLELGILIEHLTNAHPVCEQIEDEGDPDPVTADARLATADRRIDADAIKEGFIWH